jgi:molecular chaperone GrpE
MVKEKAEAILYANTDLMKAMLEVLDNFDRAEQAALATGDIEAIKEGIAMINKALIEVLSSKGLAKIASTGHEFNPEVHQAIAMVEDEAGTLKKDTVAEEYQAGYTLNERVLRPATVRVTKASNNVD